MSHEPRPVEKAQSLLEESLTEMGRLNHGLNVSELAKVVASPPLRGDGEAGALHDFASIPDQAGFRGYIDELIQLMTVGREQTWRDATASALYVYGFEKQAWEAGAKRTLRRRRASSHPRGMYSATDTSDPHPGWSPRTLPTYLLARQGLLVGLDEALPLPQRAAGLVFAAALLARHESLWNWRREYLNVRMTAPDICRLASVLQITDSRPADITSAMLKRCLDEIRNEEREAPLTRSRRSAKPDSAPSIIARTARAAAPRVVSYEELQQEICRVTGKTNRNITDAVKRAMSHPDFLLVREDDPDGNAGVRWTGD